MSLILIVYYCFFFQFLFQLLLDDTPKNDHMISGNDKKENDFFRQHSQPDVKPSWEMNSASSNQMNQNLEKSKSSLSYWLWCGINKYFFQMNSPPKDLQ